METFVSGKWSYDAVWIWCCQFLWKPPIANAQPLLDFLIRRQKSKWTICVLLAYSLSLFCCIVCIKTANYAILCSENLVMCLTHKFGCLGISRFRRGCPLWPGLLPRPSPTIATRNTACRHNCKIYSNALRINGRHSLYICRGRRTVRPTNYQTEAGALWRLFIVAAWPRDRQNTCLNTAAKCVPYRRLGAQRCNGFHSLLWQQ